MGALLWKSALRILISACAHYSDASKVKPSRRLPPTSEYSTRGKSDGEKETTLERLRRLRSEVEDLEDDVKREALLKQAEDDEILEGSGAGSSKGKGKKREVSAVVFLQQLQMLRGDLGNLEVGVHQATATRSAVESLESGSEDASIAPVPPKASSSLLSKLGFGSSAASSRTAEAQSPIQGSNVGAPTSQALVMDSQLEKRLAEIERVVGANEADINEVSIACSLSQRVHTYTSPHRAVFSRSNTTASNTDPSRPSPHLTHTTTSPRLYLSTRQSPSFRPRAPARNPTETWRQPTIERCSQWRFNGRRSWYRRG